MSTLKIRLRPATQEDVPFIFSSWLKSYRNSLYARNITSTTYFSEHHKIIQNIVKKNPVIIACNDADPSQVYGYICAGKTEGIFTLHYIYIKQSFRTMGIAKSLMQSMGFDSNVASIYTHHTRTAERLAAKYNMLYHPYVLFNIVEKDDERSKK